MQQQSNHGRLLKGDENHRRMILRKTCFVVIVAIIFSLIGTSLGCSKRTSTTTTAAKTSASSTTSTTSSSTSRSSATKPATSPTSVEPVKIGVLESVTGPYAVYGSAYLAGQKVAIQMINDAGGIKSLGGAKIVAAVGAGDSTATTSVSEMERLINSEKVVAITGPTATAEVLAMAPLAERYKTPLVSRTQDNSQFEKGARYLFSVGHTSQTIGKLGAEFVDWLAKNYGAPADKIAVAYMTPAWDGPVEAEIARLAELGYKNIVLKESFPATVTDQSPLVLKLKAANPSLVVYLGAAQDGIAFHKASYTYDYYPWLVSQPASFGQANIRDGLGPDVAKKTLARPNAFAAGTNIPTDTYSKTASFKAFQDAIEKAYPGNKFDPSITSLGATPVFVLAKALDMAASRNPDAIANALRKVTIEAPNPYLVWADMYPRLVMSDSGRVAGGSIQAAQWPDDLSSPLQAIWPPEIATAKPRVQK